MIGLMKNRQAAAREAAGAATDSPDFEAAFNEHWGRIFRVLLRLVGDPAEAEDLALETFVRLHKQFPLVTADFNLAGWLYRVATNLGLQSIRSHKRREGYELAAGRGALDGPAADSPAELAEREESHRLARLALIRLHGRQAELLTLRYSGLSYKEIAAALGLSPASIGPLLFRAERDFEKGYRELAKEDL
jgi:RNA polymerase sigma-70 factor (ECF subfamily)